MLEEGCIEICEWCASGWFEERGEGPEHRNDGGESWEGREEGRGCFFESSYEDLRVELDTIRVSEESVGSLAVMFLFSLISSVSF